MKQSFLWFMVVMCLFVFLAVPNMALSFVQGTYTGPGYTVTVDGSGVVSSVAISSTVSVHCSSNIDSGGSDSNALLSKTISNFVTNTATGFSGAGILNYDAWFNNTYQFSGAPYSTDNSSIIVLDQGLSYYRHVKSGSIYEETCRGGNSDKIYLFHESLINGTDTIAPAITSFTIPATSTSLTVPITSFTATETPSNGFIWYLVTESASKPSINDSGWSGTPPASFTFTSVGNKTLYAWTKDVKGNISAPLSGQVLVGATLTVIKNGSGRGLVFNMSIIDGEIKPDIDCGSKCSSSYAADKPVSVSATAYSGSTFAGWSGCDSISDKNCTVTMNGARSVTATFTSSVINSINGVCGSANNTAVSIVPTSGLCANGSASSVSGSGPWSWTCSGVNGGTTVNCTANSSSTAVTTTITPKTGQAICYDTLGTAIACTGTGQDGELQMGGVWPNPRFVDNGDQTQTDKLTGLIWSKNANPATIAKTWQEALDYIKSINNSNYLGHSDWRLPNKNEMKSLVNQGESSTAIWLNGQGFSNVQSYNYWSGTSSADSFASAWSVGLAMGSVGSVTISGKDASYYVWPVRSGLPVVIGSLAPFKTGQMTCYDTDGALITCVGTGQDGELQTGTAWPIPRFIDNSLMNSTEKTVTDTLTGLTWSKDANLSITTKTWQQALDYIKTLNSTNYLSHNDWRLPNANELVSLANSSQSDNASWLNTQGFINVQYNNGYWSSTNYTGYTGYAWFVDMGNGYLDDNSKTVNRYVWPVRLGYPGLSGSIINGTCGSSNGQMQSAAPTANLCTAGTASVITGTGPWSWSCAGTNGGTTATCSANITSAVCTANYAPVCGIDGKNYANSCYASLAGVSVAYSGECATPVNGACGISNAATFAVKPATNLCSTGTASAVTETTTWNWSCASINGGTNATCTANIDTSKPMLTLSTLADGAITNNATLNISGTVTSNNGAVSVKINNAAVTVTNGAFSTPITLQSGANTITTVATDTLGRSTTDSRIITLDTTAPTLTVSAPADNSTTTQGTATITGTVNETSTVAVKVNDGAAQSAAMSGNAFNATVNLKSGLNTIDVIARDLAGNTATVKRSVTYDNGALSLSVSNPNQDTSTTESSITISGTVTDVVSSATVTITADGQSYTPTVAQDGSFSQSIPLPSDKTYAVVVTATDLVENTTSVQRNIIKATPLTQPTIADALKVFQAVVGLNQLNASEQLRYDVAPLGSSGNPLGNGVIDAADVILILRRSIGIGSW